MERYPRESFQLATKNAAWIKCESREDAIRQFETSLERTGAGYFDFYLLHNLGEHRTHFFDDFDMWNFVKEKKAEGKIRHYGFSFHSTPEELEEILKKLSVEEDNEFGIILRAKGIIPDKDTLPDGLLEMLPWVMAVTLIGEHRIEANSMNRTGSRSGTKDYDSDDNGDKDGDAEAALEKTYEKAYVWREDRIGASPETIFIRKETRRELLESMTDKQREVFTLYYYDGLKQREIAERLGISRDSVNDRLECALKKVKKLF